VTGYRLLPSVGPGGLGGLGDSAGLGSRDTQLGRMLRYLALLIGFAERLGWILIA